MNSLGMVMERTQVRIEGWGLLEVLEIRPNNSLAEKIQIQIVLDKNREG